jgi:hypothetical protein
MELRMPALALLAACLPLQASILMPADLPAGFVQNAQDQQLLGAPRRVRLTEVTQHAFSQDRTEDLYDADGVLVSHVVVSGRGRRHAGADSYKLRLGPDHRLLELVYAPARDGGSALVGSARPLRHDADGRVTALAGPDGPAVTLIAYEPGRQVHDVYVDKVFTYQLVYEFDDSGRLRRSHCTRGHCEAAPLREYGPLGPTLTVDGDLETQWHYRDGVLAATVTQYRSATTPADLRYYEAYRFDACGNWIYREQYATPPGTPGRQPLLVARREIDYHQPCPAAALR